MSHNAIATIENNSFENCANITLLDLSHNMIEQIPRDTFDSTTYAYELQLSYNFLTDLSQVGNNELFNNILYLSCIFTGSFA